MKKMLLLGGSHAEIPMIQAAKKMICDSSMSFTQIAERLGFGSVHYFSNLFKEKTGMTPSEYAKSLNKHQ